MHCRFLNIYISMDLLRQLMYPTYKIPCAILFHLNIFNSFPIPHILFKLNTGNAIAEG